MAFPEKGARIKNLKNDTGEKRIDRHLMTIIDVVPVKEVAGRDKIGG